MEFGVSLLWHPSRMRLGVSRRLAYAEVSGLLTSPQELLIN